MALMCFQPGFPQTDMYQVGGGGGRRSRKSNKALGQEKAGLFSEDTVRWQQLARFVPFSSLSLILFNAHCQSLAEAGWWRGIWLSCSMCTGGRQKETKEGRV